MCLNFMGMLAHESCEKHNYMGLSIKYHDTVELKSTVTLNYTNDYGFVAISTVGIHTYCIAMFYTF